MNNHGEKIDGGYQAGRIAYDRGDYETARKKLYPLAEQGTADAQHIIGMMIYDLNQNFSEAVKWFKRAAKQGHVHAQYDLAMSYREGLGASQNHGEAVKWFKRAAAQGHIHARHELGGPDHDDIDGDSGGQCNHRASGTKQAGNSRRACQ